MLSFSFIFIRYYRIIKLRISRAKRAMKNFHRASGDKYRYESRHLHAQGRIRNDKGRFISKSKDRIK